MSFRFYEQKNVKEEIPVKVLEPNKNIANQPTVVAGNKDSVEKPCENKENGKESDRFNVKNEKEHLERMKQIINKKLESLNDKSKNIEKIIGGMEESTGNTLNKNAGEKKESIKVLLPTSLCEDTRAKRKYNLAGKILREKDLPLNKSQQVTLKTGESLFNEKENAKTKPFAYSKQQIFKGPTSTKETMIPSIIQRNMRV